MKLGRAFHLCWWLWLTHTEVLSLPYIYNVCKYIHCNHKSTLYVLESPPSPHPWLLHYSLSLWCHCIPHMKAWYAHTSVYIPQPPKIPDKGSWLEKKTKTIGIDIHTWTTRKCTYLHMLNIQVHKCICINDLHMIDSKELLSKLLMELFIASSTSVIRDTKSTLCNCFIICAMHEIHYSHTTNVCMYMYVYTVHMIE